MAKAVATLFIELKGKFAEFSSGMQKAAGAVEKFSKRLDAQGSRLTKGITLPLIGFAKVALEAATAADDAFDRIRIGTGATGEKLEALEQSFKNIAGDVPNSLSETATAISDLNTRLGLTGQPLEKLTVQMLNLARITGQDLASILPQVTELFNNWKISTEQQGDVLDYLFRVSQSTGVGVGQLSDQLVKLSAPLKSSGFDVETAAALLGKFGKEGINAEAAVRGFNKAIATLASKGVTDIPAALQQIVSGIQNTKSESEQTALAVSVFGQKVGVNLATAIREGRFNINEFVASLKTSGETINGAASDTDGFSEILRQLKNDLYLAAGPLEGVFTEALTFLRPMLQLVIDKVKDLSDKFTQLAPQTKALVVAFVAFAAAIGPIVIIIAALISPMALVIAGALALTAAWFYLKDSAIELLSSLGDLWQELTAFASAVADKVVEGFERAADGATAAFDKIADVIGGAKDKIIQTAHEIYIGVKTWLVDKFNDIVTGIQAGVDKITGFFDGMYISIIGRSSVPDTIDGIEEEFDSLDSAMVEPAEKATEKTSNVFALFAKKTKGHLSDTEKETKKQTKRIAESFETIEDALVNTTDEIDPALEGIEKLVADKNKNGLEDLAKSFVKSSRSAELFGRAVKEAASQQRDVEKFRDKLRDLAKDAVEGFQRSEKALDPMVEKLKELIELGDQQGIVDLGKQFIRTGEDAAKFKDYLADASREAKTLGSEIAQGGYAFETWADAIESAAGNGGAIVSAFGELISSSDLVANTLSSAFQAIGVSAKAAGAVVSGFASVLEVAGTAFEQYSDLQAGVISGLAVVGAAIGGYYGGAEGAAGGAQIGGAIGQTLAPFLEDNDSPDAIGRDEIESYLEDYFAQNQGQFFNSEGMLQAVGSNFLFGDESAFDNPNWGEQFQAFGQEAFNTFNGLGYALQGLLGITENVGGQIGYILATNLNGNIDNARLLVQQLGLDVEDVRDALLRLGEQGVLSWQEVFTAMSSVEEAFKPGLAAIGDYMGAFEQLIQSGGRGKVAILALKNVAIEAMEAGAQSFDDLKANLIATGQFTDAEITAIFQSLSQNGVTTLQELADVSTETGGHIIADMDSLGIQFTEVAASAGSIAEQLNELPNNVEKNIEFNIRTNFDSNTQHAIDNGLFTKTNIDLPKQGGQAFAKGGVVNGATFFKHRGGLGLMGEAGAEAILPLTRIGGQLGVLAEGLGSGAVSINIDARGAAPGVEEKIMSAIRQAEDQIVNRTISKVVDMKRRGGSFAHAF